MYRVFRIRNVNFTRGSVNNLQLIFLAPSQNAEFSLKAKPRTLSVRITIMLLSGNIFPMWINQINISYSFVSVRDTQG